MYVFWDCVNKLYIIDPVTIATEFVFCYLNTVLMIHVPKLIVSICVCLQIVRGDKLPPPTCTYMYSLNS